MVGASDSGSYFPLVSVSGQFRYGAEVDLAYDPPLIRYSGVTYVTFVRGGVSIWKTYVWLSRGHGYKHSPPCVGGGALGAFVE